MAATRFVCGWALANARRSPGTAVDCGRRIPVDQELRVALGGHRGKVCTGPLAPTACGGGTRGTGRHMCVPGVGWRKEKSCEDEEQLLHQGVKKRGVEVNRSPGRAPKSGLRNQDSSHALKLQRTFDTEAWVSRPRGNRSQNSVREVDRCGQRLTQNQGFRGSRIQFGEEHQSLREQTLAQQGSAPLWRTGIHFISKRLVMG